jgi:hypothetical protein
MFLIPAEGGAVAPHLVQDYGELASDNHVPRLRDVPTCYWQAAARRSGQGFAKRTRRAWP